MIKKFEVKTGRHAGYYLVVENEKKAKKFFPVWGMLPRETFYNFHIRHNIKLGQIVLGHSVWAKGIMKKHWLKAK
jgi:hypothetical protein